MRRGQGAFGPRQSLSQRSSSGMCSEYGVFPPIWAPLEVCHLYYPDSHLELLGSLARSSRRWCCRSRR